MKLKAPKTWQLVVILVMIFVLAIGGSVLAVYLTTGFRPQLVYPQSIVIDDLDSTYNSQNSQYEIVDAFKLKITSPTEGVTNGNVTLNFAPGKQVVEDKENGTISDGTIIVPKQVTLGEEFTIQPVKTGLVDNDGLAYESNVGGISSLVITTENNLLSSTTIQIAVDVPVHAISFNLVDSTTGEVFQTGNKIAENTNFEIQTEFYPQNSKYLFSDDKNTAVTQKREKQVFFEVSNIESVNGVSLVYNGGDVYFIASEEPSKNNIINGYAFANATQQLSFYQENSQTSGQPLYNEAIRVLSTQEDAVSASVSIDIVEANVRSFTINDTSSSSLKITTNKLFRVSAGTSALSDATINTQIIDMQDNVVSALIKNVGVRVFTIDGKTPDENSTEVTIKGGETVTIEDGEEKASYVLFNSDVKNLNHAYWEVSTTGSHDFVLEVVLIIENEEGQKQVFDKQTQRLVYFETEERTEDVVTWGDIEEKLSLSIIYDENGNTIPAQYEKDLNTVSNVPSSNIYQKKIFFVYIDESSALPEGKTLADYVSVSKEGSSRYQFNGTSAYLYPLMGGELIVKDTIDFYLIFATVRTDAYGNVLKTTSGTYMLEQVSTSISVSVDKTLQGLEAYNLQVEEKWLNQEGGNFFVIPTGTAEAFTLNLTLVDGDSEIFMQEYNAGRIKFYAAEDANGERAKDGVFSFGQPEVVGNQVTIQVGVSNFSVSELNGEDYYVCISYNNSINTNVWVAQPTGEGDFYGAIRVYNQTPSSISNDRLEGWKFDVQQSLQTNGNGSISIVGNKTGQEPVMLESVEAFNQLINGITNEDGERTGGMVIKDQYGRQFEYAYEIVSDDNSVVSFSSEGSNHNVTFGASDPAGKDVGITVRAGRQEFTFTINSKSTGITSIEVGGVKQDSISSAQYTMAGKAGEYVTLKDLIEVYVSAGKYNSDAYTLKISQFTISEQDESLWDMFEFNGGDTTYEGEINQVKINHNFGQNVSILFNASNEQGTLNFNFTLNITSVASDGINNLGNINYNIKGIESGVREQDKPTGEGQLADIVVYSGYKIHLDSYLKVNVEGSTEDSTFSWGNVDAYNTEYELKADDGSEIATIQKLAAVPDEFTEGIYLIFNDVQLPVTKTFVLYSLFDDAGNGNPYAYNRSISVTILPNFELTAKNAGEEITLSLKDLYLTAGKYNIANILDLKRITENNNNNGFVYTNDLGYKLENFEFIDQSGYLNFDKTVSVYDTGTVSDISIKLNKGIEYDYGEMSKQVVVSMRDDDGIEIASADVNIQIGITVDDMIDNGAGDWLGNTVFYDNREVILVANSTEIFNNIIITSGETGPDSEAISVTVGENRNAYSNNQATTPNSRSLAFVLANEISVGDRYYISIRFTSGNSDFASIKVPILISAVGDRFASYQNTEDDLKEILDGTHAPFEIDAGKSYLLALPDKINDKDYIIVEGTKDNESTKDNKIYLINSKLSGTNASFTIDNKEFEIGLSDGNDLILSFSLVGQATGVEISPSAVGVGDVFTLTVTDDSGKTSYTLYLESLEQAGEVYNIGLYQVEELQGIEYAFAEGAFGLEIASLGGKTVLTGLGAKENSYLVNFSVPNQFEDFMRIATNSTFNVPELIVKHIDNSVCTDGYIQAYIEILQSKSNHSYKYNYNLIIESDGIIAQPTYPFDGATSEFVEMDAGTAKQPTIKEIVLNAQMGNDTQHPGVARISDMFGTSDVSEDATLKIKEVKIGNDVIAISPDGLEANDARFSVKLEGMKVIFKNVSGQNITVVLERSYTQVYGGDITYSFSINAQSVEYFIEYTNPDEGHGTLDENTWTLSRGKTEQTITAVTKQRTTGGESNVDTARVTTTITHNFPTGYEIEYDKDDFIITLTVPGFIRTDTIYQIYFTVNGVQTATLNVLIPATVEATQAATTLNAGNTVESSGLITLSEGATINGIQVVDDAGNPTTNDYVSVVGATAIKLENAIEDQEFKLKFTYEVGENNGHVIFGYTALANMAGVKEYNAGSIIAGTTKEIDALEFAKSTIDGELITSDDMKNFTISATPQDANIVKAGSVTYNSETAKLSIKPEYVGANTPTSVTVVFNYTEAIRNKVLFTLTTQISLVVTPAIKISVNYPAPAGKSLGYESIEVKTTDEDPTVANFFTGTALFASKARFTVQAYTEAGLGAASPIKEDEVEKITFSVVQSSNITVTRNGDDLTIKRGTEAGLSYATIQIIYKGVVAQYTIYAFDKLITSTPNATINKVGTTEVIYADRTNTEELGGRYRLLELNVTENASNGSIYSIYARPKNQSQADDETNLGTFLTSFKMSSTYFNSTIYVDHGNNNLKQVGDTFKLGEEGNEEEVDIIICIGNVQIADGSITFSRLAGRVEYHYATNDGNSILITSTDITYNSDLTLEGEGNTTWDKDETATLTVTYNLKSTTGAGATTTGNGATTLTLVKKLDITVEMEYSAASPTIVEVEAHKNSYYKLSELAGITFASTGEKLTAANIGDAELSVEIINTKQNSIDGWNKKDLVYQNKEGSAYLLFTNITGGEGDNKVVYDFYLYAQGCSVDGDYAAVRFTYKISEGVSESFIIIVKIIPDYQVTIAGNVVAEAGNVYEDADSKTGEDYYVSNQQRPYEFTPVVTGEGEGATYKAMTLASSEQPTDQLISVVRQNWNATNIAYSFNYSIKVMADGSAYNTTSTIGKLNLSNGWQGGSVNAGSTWKPKPSDSNAAKITPLEVVFGTKSYMVELSDNFGYIIRFYFNLVPSSDQQPVVYESASAATFTEGTPFDVGLVYDSIAVQKADSETGTQASVTVNQSLTPNTQDVSSIILQNIDAWGYTTAGVQQADAAGIDGKYYNAPTFANVTITNITFRFDESTAEGVPMPQVQKLTKLGTNTTCKAMPGQGVLYNDVEYTYNPTASGIQLTTSLQVIAKEESVEGKDEKVTKYYIYMNAATDPTGEKGTGKYEVTFDEDSGNITKIGGKAVTNTNGTYTIAGTTTMSFKVRKQGTNTYLNFTFTGTGGTIKLDLSNSVTYTTTSESTTRLATDVTLAPLYTTPATGTNTSSLAAWTDVYRDISAAYFKVPIMPGWIYGTSDSANVTIYITLKYEVEGTGGSKNTETCQVAYNATIVKNVRISSTSRVVADAVGFNLEDKISVDNQGTKPTETVYYDDTLVVVVPKQGQVTLTVTFVSGDSAVEKITPITNTKITRKVSNYVSLSELYGKTLDPTTVKIKVTWTTNDNSDDSGAAVYYHDQPETAGSPIATYTSIPQSGSDELSLPEVTRDVLYIEHAGRISGSDSFQVRKSYIVGVKYGEKYEYYQYRHDYLVTSRYTYFSDGLTGGDTVYEIEGKNEKDKYTTAYDPTNGYTVAFDQWAGNITVYRAKDGDSGGLMQGDGANLTIAWQPSLRYEVAKLNDDDPNPPTASFDADGQTLYTGADYSANKNQYIRINIYIKASGGPTTPWKGDDEYDKLLGFIIITLTTGWDSKPGS